MRRPKTPGVFIKEVETFPAGVVPAATAVPAFIGYTQRAGRGAKDLTGVPTRLSSLAEFHELFGAGPTTRFTIDGRGTPEVVNRTRFLLYAGMRMFFANGGGTCYVTSVGTYEDEKSAEALRKPLAALEREQAPDLLVVPDAVLLGRVDGRRQGDPAAWAAVSQAALLHCEKVRRRFAIVDVYDGATARTHDPDDDVISGRARGFRGLIDAALAWGAVYYPWLHTTVHAGDEVSWANIAPASRDALVEHLAAAFRNGDESQPMSDAVSELLAQARRAMDHEGEDAGAGTRARTHAALMAISGTYRGLMEDIRAQLNLLPPSAAMAGVYARVDGTRGVFQAPANVTIAGVVAPAVAISHEEQDDLNAPPDGKAVNAIRTFTGLGVLVWGARTLDGNSPEGRYIQIRRTMIMLEQSIRLALSAYGSEANVARTWVAVRAAIVNFLTLLWREGGLAGASPQDAFSVDVGLGSTMTVDDVRDGRMRVVVAVALVRPAEFMVMRFEQTLQTP
ncbi:MAG TPA: phage tail sheath C-terminal domain-containing protein [Pseudomonadales bacterium]|nr:phage tail sheath C-terminal domain-containing protein [Pseudomonadales bacterium]